MLCYLCYIQKAYLKIQEKASESKSIAGESFAKRPSEHWCVSDTPLNILNCVTEICNEKFSDDFILQKSNTSTTTRA